VRHFATLGKVDNGAILHSSADADLDPEAPRLDMQQRALVALAGDKNTAFARHQIDDCRGKSAVRARQPERKTRTPRADQTPRSCSRPGPSSIAVVGSECVTD
jgi:hypothetical protein